MGLFRAPARKMPLVQARLDNSNRPTVPAQFGQLLGQDLGRYQNRSETESLTCKFMVGVARFPTSHPITDEILTLSRLVDCLVDC